MTRSSVAYEKCIIFVFPEYSFFYKRFLSSLQYLWTIARLRGPKSRLNGLYLSSLSMLNKKASGIPVGSLKSEMKYSLPKAKSENLINIPFTISNCVPSPIFSVFVGDI